RTADEIERGGEVARQRRHRDRRRIHRRGGRERRPERRGLTRHLQRRSRRRAFGQKRGGEARQPRTVDRILFTPAADDEPDRDDRESGSLRVVHRQAVRKLEGLWDRETERTRRARVWLLIPPLGLPP